MGWKSKVTGQWDKRQKVYKLESAPADQCPFLTLISYPVLPIITRSDFLKRVGPFFKDCSIGCFVPYNDAPSGFLIIVLGSYQISVASLCLHGNINIIQRVMSVIYVVSVSAVLPISHSHGRTGKRHGQMIITR